MRSNHSEACKKRAQRAASRDKAGTAHPLDDARGQVEEGKTASEWALIAREHVMRTLLGTGYFTADDLEPLGIPEHYRRHLHGLITAHFRGPEPYMEEAGRRKSERPERKGAKNTVFRITAKGRRELPAKLRALTSGVGAGSSGQLDGDASADRGGETTGVGAGVPSSQEAEGSSFLSSPIDASSHPGGQSRPSNVDDVVPAKEGLSRAQLCDDVDSSGDSSVATSSAAEESSPTLFDASEARERPRSAWTDEEELAA